MRPTVRRRGAKHKRASWGRGPERGRKRRLPAIFPHLSVSLSLSLSLSLSIYIYIYTYTYIYIYTYTYTYTYICIYGYGSRLKKPVPGTLRITVFRCFGRLRAVPGTLCITVFRCFCRLRGHSPAIGPAPVDFFGFWNFLRDHRQVHKACRTEDLMEDLFTTSSAIPKRGPCESMLNFPPALAFNGCFASGAGIHPWVATGCAWTAASEARIGHTPFHLLTRSLPVSGNA